MSPRSAEGSESFSLTSRSQEDTDSTVSAAAATAPINLIIFIGHASARLEVKADSNRNTVTDCHV